MTTFIIGLIIYNVVLIGTAIQMLVESRRELRNAA